MEEETTAKMAELTESLEKKSKQLDNEVAA